MAQYIDKDALLAEIDRRKEKCELFYNVALSNNAEFAKLAIEEQKKQYDSFKGFINTLEVKEGDLNKEIELVKGDYEQVDVAWNNDFEYIAKHFFELGVNVSNPLTWEDISDIIEIHEDVLEMESCENVYMEVLKRFKAQKGE